MFLNIRKKQRLQKRY